MNDPAPEIIVFEHRVWDALVAGDAVADATLLHEGFIGVYPDGFAVRADHISQLANGPTIHSYALDRIKTERMGQDHALICYRASFQRSADAMTEVMYVSSIWRKTGDGWCNIFSQDTPEG